MASPGKLSWFLMLCCAGFVWLYSFFYFDHIHNFTFFNRNQSKPKGCKIPILDPWDKEVATILKPVNLPLVCNKSSPDLSFLTKDGLLKFDRELVSQHDNLRCSYTCVKRGKDDHDILFDSEISIDLNNDVKIECEFPQVNCYEKDKLVYARPHAQIIPDKNRMKQLDQILPINQQKNYHHLILIVIDSASRLNFERFCPKSKKMLVERYKSVIFKGMTRNGKESYGNAVALLTGKFPYNYSDDVIYRQYWDNWPLIWKNYSNSGYVTLDNEDGTSNLFVMLKKGFKKQPTDHRFRVFWQAISKLQVVDDRWNHIELCYRNEAKHRIQLEFLRSFLTAYEANRPKFAMFWNTCLCHDTDETLAYFDDDFSTFLQSNYHLLKDSFLFVLGDHGSRFGTVSPTTVGHFESHMPLLMVSVPERVRIRQPQIIENMQKNSELLISHYDTFVTFHDILESQKHGWGNLDNQKNWTHLHVDVPAPQSYLRPVNTDRTCEQIGIPPESCICKEQMHYTIVDKNDPLTENISKSVITELNRIVAIDQRCAKMAIIDILKLEELSPFSSHEKYKDKKRTFRISILVRPSNGTFEANVRSDGDNFEVDGEIVRTNRHGNQFYCIANDHPDIKAYCYCR